MISSDVYNDLFDEIIHLDTINFKGTVPEEQIFYVDLNTRNITIPSAFTKEFAIRGDHMAETVWFAINRHFDGVDLEHLTWGVQVEDPKKNRKLLLLERIQSGVVDNFENKENFDKDALFLGWPITFDVTEFAGDISVALCCYSTETKYDEQGNPKLNLTYRLGTNTIKLKIKDSLYLTDKSQNITPPLARIEELIIKADELLGKSGTIQINWADIDKRPGIELDGVPILSGNGGTVVKFTSDQFKNISYNQLNDKPVYTINGKELTKSTILKFEDLEEKPVYNYTINGKELTNNVPLILNFEDLEEKPIYKIKDKYAEYEIKNGTPLDLQPLKFDYSQIENIPNVSYDDLSDKPIITVDGVEYTIGIDKIEVSKIAVDTALNETSVNPVQNQAVAVKVNALQKSIDDLWEEMDGMTFIPLSISSFECEPKLAEIGSTVNTVNFTWTIGGTPTLVKINSESIPLGTSQATLSNLELKEDKEFTLYAEDRKENNVSAITQLLFVNKVFHGVQEIPSEYNTSFINKLVGQLQINKEGVIDVTANENQYIYYALPSSYGDCVFTSGGFSGGFTKVDTISYTNEYGVTTDYDIWKSDNANLGQTNITIS